MKNTWALTLTIGLTYFSRLVECHAQPPKGSKSPFITVKTQRKIDTSLVRFLGMPLLTVLMNSDSIQGSLLDTDRNAKETTSFGTYALLQKGTKLPFRQQDFLMSIVTTTESYGLDSLVKNCLFNPAVGFEFFYKNQKAQLLICFDCDEWRFTFAGQPIKQEDCDFARPALIRLCKKVFPTDKIIQQLK